MHQDKQLCVCLSSHSPAAMKPWQSRKLKKKVLHEDWVRPEPEVKTLLFSCHDDAFGLRPITLEAVVSCGILWGEQRNTLRVLLMDKSVCLIHTDPLFMVNPPSTGLNLHTRTCTHTHTHTRAQSLSHSLTQLPHRSGAIRLTPPESLVLRVAEAKASRPCRDLWPWCRSWSRGAERCLCF